MPTTKGISITNARGFLEDHFGAGAWERLLAATSAEDRTILGSAVAVGWYDLALYARMIRVLDDTFGRGDLELLKPLGRYAAERDFSTIHRLFFRLASPIYAIEKTAAYWRRFHDTGVWQVTREGDGRASGTLRDWGHVDTALCREMMAYMTRVLELVGAKDVRLVHPLCRAEGQVECAFTLLWRGKDGTTLA